MTNDELQTQLRSPQAANLRACFPSLAERDVMQILCSPPQHTVHILQQCFDCDLEDAKAAWNDYVMRYIDGVPANGSRDPGTPRQTCASTQAGGASRGRRANMFAR